MDKRYRVTWEDAWKDKTIEYTQTFRPLSKDTPIEQVPSIFVRQVTRSQQFRILRVEELE